MSFRSHVLRYAREDHVGLSVLLVRTSQSPPPPLFWCQHHCCSQAPADKQFGDLIDGTVGRPLVLSFFFSVLIFGRLCMFVIEICTSADPFERDTDPL
jgi:hypothetical protein